MPESATLTNPNLQRALALIDEATAGITDAELAWHAEGKWPPATILEHLSMAFAGTAKGLKRTLDAGKIECRRRTAKECIMQLATTGFGYMPEGRTAPKQATPTGEMTGAQAMLVIRENLSAMDSAISRAAGKFGTRRKIMVHPILGPLTLAQWTKFHYVHTRHHMKQVRARRRQAGAELSATAGSR